MNKIMKCIYWVGIATTFFIISCSDRLDNFELDYEGDRLVVIGVLSEKGLRVTLTKSYNPYKAPEKDESFVRNGRVWLYQNDTLIAELHKQQVFEFVLKNYTPSVGGLYKIKAIAEGFDTLVSESIHMPAPPIIKSHHFKKDDGLAINSYNGSVSFTVQLQDYANVRNNYMIDSYIYIRADSIDQYRLKGTVYNGNTSDACEFDSWANIPFFTDKCFDGGEYKINYFSEHERKGTIIVDLSSINESFLKHLRSLEQPIGLEKGFAEPKIQYSNIQNGYGVFVAKNTKSFSFKLD